MNHFAIKIFNKFGLLKQLNLTSSITLNKVKFKIPIIARMGISYLNPSEIWLIDLLKTISSLNNGTILDVGVNIGQTLLKIKSLNHDVEYYGFEPNSSCLHYLKQLISENKLTKTTIFPIAISDNNQLSILEFYFNNYTDSSASLIQNFRPNQKVLKREHVPTFDISTINTHIDLTNFTLLKIDVEGGEMEVLLSFRNELSKYQPFILMEILPVYKEENKERLNRQNVIEKLLYQLNYSIYRICISNGKFKGFEKISSIGIHSDLNKCEYFIVPEKFHDQFILINKKLNY